VSKIRPAFISPLTVSISCVDSCSSLRRLAFSFEMAPALSNFIRTLGPGGAVWPNSDFPVSSSLRNCSMRATASVTVVRLFVMLKND